MAEIPLVIVVVQRGGPSTGLPTKVEQGELLPSIFGSPGDDPKIVLAAATIEECFHFVILARNLAERFRGPVVLLTDANLATGVQPFPRPEINASWFAAPLDQSPWNSGTKPYDWDPETGLSPRPIPGQRGGEYVLTGLAHTRQSKVAYDPDSNQMGCEMRSRKLATLRRSLKPPTVFGEPEGDLLIVGWGSTLGAIEEAVGRAQREGMKVSSVHLRFVSPLEPGLKDIFSRFKQVCTVEINYGDPPTGDLSDPDVRRHAQLARLLRMRTIVDVDSFSNVHGQPMAPSLIYNEIRRRLGKAGVQS
jgi:2-oxoglutarate ferredoxin oxidoreductase subunit alpha